MRKERESWGRRGEADRRGWWGRRVAEEGESDGDGKGRRGKKGRWGVEGGKD